MSDKPLFQGMDEREREIAPEQLPAEHPGSERVNVDRSPDTDPSVPRDADGMVVPIGGLMSRPGETLGAGAAGPAPAVPGVPAVPVAPAPTDVSANQDEDVDEA
jgi:hypothetical protein